MLENRSRFLDSSKFVEVKSDLKVVRSERKKVSVSTGADGGKEEEPKAPIEFVSIKLC